MKDKTLLKIGTSVVGGLIAWNVWLSDQVITKTDEEKVKEIVATQAPYVEDRKLIMTQLAESKSTNVKLTNSIDELSGTLIKLKTIIEERIPKEGGG